MTMEATLKRLIAVQPKSERYAFKQGYDSVVSGPDLVNCHFSVFATPENTKAWERGAAEAGKNASD